MELAFEYGNEILIEKFIKGKEVQVGILGDRALGAIEIVPKSAFYDYKAKYEKGNVGPFLSRPGSPRQSMNGRLKRASPRIAPSAAGDTAGSTSSSMRAARPTSSK